MKIKPIFTAFLITTLATGCAKELNIPFVEKIVNPDDLTASQANQDKPVANGPADLDCADFQRKLPRGWRGKTLSVLENPDDENSPKIKIYYYTNVTPARTAPKPTTQKPTEQKPAAKNPTGETSDSTTTKVATEAVTSRTPVIFINDGPGISSHAAFEALAKRNPSNDEEKNIQWIFFDQRGNGCSDFYPQGNSAEALDRLAHYGSKAIINDAEEIRKDLKIEQWIAYGHGYGAEIAHRYAESSPKSLKAVFAHGGAIASDAQQKLENQIRAQVHVLNDYLNVYKLTEQKILETLYEKLTATECFEVTAKKIDDTSKTKSDSSKDETPAAEEKICGHAVLAILAEKLGYTDQWGSIHDSIDKMLSEGKLNAEEISKFLAANNNSQPINPDNLKDTAKSVINLTNRNIVPTDRFHCLLVKDALAKATDKIDLSKVLLHGCMGVLQNEAVAEDTSKPYQGLKLDIQSLDTFVSALKSSKLPFYLYSGNQDSVFPVETFAEELAKTPVDSFPNLHYAQVAVGHDGFKAERQIWQDLVKEISR